MTRDPASGTTDAGRWIVRARLMVLDHVSEVDVPVQVERQASVLVATADVRLSQSALGLRPISIALGALRVDDSLDVHCRVVARRTSAGAMN